MCIMRVPVPVEHVVYVTFDHSKKISTINCQAIMSLHGLSCPAFPPEFRSDISLLQCKVLWGKDLAPGCVR